MSPKRSKTSPFREWRKKQAYNLLPLFPPLGALVIRGIGITLRIRFTGHLAVLGMVESGDPFVLAFFHGRQFLLAYRLQSWKGVIMSSISYLGEIQARIMSSFGFVIIRGSRSRGGSRVLAEMIGLVRKGRIGAFAVDGPRGPYREVKPGVVYVAKKLGIPVVPATTSAWPSVIFGSTWDRYLLPLPFSRCTIHFGEPLYLESDMSDESIAQDCVRIGSALEAMEMEADVIVGRTRN